MDERRLREPYLNPRPDRRAYGPFVVRGGRVFVLGDNRINSNDSRYGIGQVAITDEVGKVVGFASGDGATLPTAATAHP